MQTRGLSRAERRKAQKYLSAAGGAYPVEMAKIAISDWPPAWRSMKHAPFMVFRSMSYLATFYDDPNGYVRMSVQRTTQFSDGNWRDGLTWDELMRVKRECGFGDAWMVEVFPPDGCIVNVASIRHMWLLREVPPYAWNRV